MEKEKSERKQYIIKTSTKVEYDEIKDRLSETKALSNVNNVNGYLLKNNNMLVGSLTESDVNDLKDEQF